MATQLISKMLSGGDRRSIGRANEIALLVLCQPVRLPELLACLHSHDVIVRMRAADAIEKISRQQAGMLDGNKVELLQLMEHAQQQELRWHLAQVIPRLSLSKAEQRRAVAALLGYLRDGSSIVRTFALQGLADLSRLIPTLRPRVRRLLEESARTGTAAMKARARKLLSATK